MSALISALGLGNMMRPKISYVIKQMHNNEPSEFHKSETLPGVRDLRPKPQPSTGRLD